MADDAPPPSPGARLEERYVDLRDGEQVFVRTYTPSEPSDEPPLVLTDGLGCQGYAWVYLIDAFKRRRRIVYWQYRGHGFSAVPKDIGSLTVVKMVEDLQDVLDDTGTERAVFFGHSMGVQVVLEALRYWPERCAGLVLLCGSFEHPIRTWHGAADGKSKDPLGNRFMRRAFPYISGAFLRFPERSQRMWQRVVPTRLSYEFAIRTEVNGRRIDRRDFMPYLEHLGKMDMRVFAQLARALAEHSAGDILHDVKAPTLVIGGGRDTFTPIFLSEEMARRIPGAEMLRIPDGSHATPVEHPELINLRVDKFLRERVEVLDA
jgi:pimeloyl-ACP methyl ester carboxylesterase